MGQEKKQIPKDKKCYPFPTCQLTQKSFIQILTHTRTHARTHTRTHAHTYTHIYYLILSFISFFHSLQPFTCLIFLPFFFTNLKLPTTHILLPSLFLLKFYIPKAREIHML
ncbi:hypothetical protein J3Q64DRAFT_1715128 [Phycomyces blakesleeanus]|uniref:C2H2-type zinc finger transcription factor n=1 Tax=Phycomyces blakesleeanus TaxID=4837 RepID=A0ABR3BH94_PHYBL